MNTLEAIAKRTSCRAYKAEQIKDEDLTKILQAANAAPVGMGKYETLKITVIQSRELLDKIDEEGKKFFNNPAMQHPLYGAPTLIMISGAANNGDITMSLCNASCLIENMTIEAADLGLGSCYIMGNTAAIRNNAEICKAMQVPEGFKPCAGIIVGYAAAEAEKRELVTDKIQTVYVK